MPEDPSPDPDPDLLARLRPGTPGTWRVLAIAYGFRVGVRGQHFLGHDARSTEPHPTAYYVWLAVSDRHVVLVDAGISRDRAATMPGMSYLGSPVELLGQVGVRPADVGWAVLTHLHYDHTGTVAELGSARYVVQQAEWEHRTGPWPQRIGRERWLWSPADLAHLLAAREQGRLELVAGDVELLPGLSLHLVGGHTAGMQVVRLRTDRGHVVLASDASHFYENLADDRPPPLLHCTAAVHGAFDRVGELADRVELVVPGHDPAVLDRHPAVSPALSGRVALIA